MRRRPGSLYREHKVAGSTPGLGGGIFSQLRAQKHSVDLINEKNPTSQRVHTRKPHHLMDIKPPSPDLLAL